MSSRTPSKREVAEAIISYSPDRLQHLIDRGYNLDLPLFDDAIVTYDHAEKEIDPGPEEMIALSSAPGESTMAFPLHVAVVCVYHAAIKGSLLGEYARKQALETIKILLVGGASWRMGCGSIIVLNVKGYDWVMFTADYPENQALHLALFLKKYASGEANEYMDVAIKLLQDASTEKKKKDHMASPKTTPVLKSVAACYKSLLFSDDFSDLTFQCSDGISVPAHRNVLAASSPYFNTAFRGDWSENNSEGIWKTRHGSELIKSVLTLVYTGSVEGCEKLLNDEGADPLHLMDLACEYEIAPLMHISVDNCAKKLEVDNVRRTLQNAHVHSCSRLKKACFEFIQKHTAKVLMNPDMMGLVTEEPGLWVELGAFLNGSASARPSKRARTDGN